MNPAIAFTAISAALLFVAYYAAKHIFEDEKECAHPYQSHYTKILDETVNCETTVTACALCGKHLTEPETECR